MIQPSDEKHGLEFKIHITYHCNSDIIHFYGVLFLIYFFWIYWNLMLSCGVCVTVGISSHLKVVCKECEKVHHRSCVDMSKADIEYLMKENLTWRCQP